MIRHPRPAPCPARRRGARSAARIWLALLAAAAIITGIVPAPAGAPGGMVPAVDAAVAVPYAAAGREQLAPGVYREIGARTTVPTSPQAIHLVEVDPFDPVISFLEAGAIGYLLKNVSINTLANAIRSGYSGQPAMAPEVMKALIHAKTSSQKPGSDLSKRELEVLALIGEGLSNEEIAERLVISPATARHHVSPCIQKLGAANRAQAAALAIKHNLIP